jgi:hypothetical protein
VPVSACRASSGGAVSAEWRACPCSAASLASSENGRADDGKEDCDRQGARSPQQADLITLSPLWPVNTEILEDNGHCDAKPTEGKPPERQSSQNQRPPGAKSIAFNPQVSPAQRLRAQEPPNQTRCSRVTRKSERETHSVPSVAATPTLWRAVRNGLLGFPCAFSVTHSALRSAQVNPGGRKSGQKRGRARAPVVMTWAHPPGCRSNASSTTSKSALAAFAPFTDLAAGGGEPDHAEITPGGAAEAELGSLLGRRSG